jgi:hypothetical protein
MRSMMKCHELLAAQVKTYSSNPRCDETERGEGAGGQRREKDRNSKAGGLRDGDSDGDIGRERV